jgi:hypothetical protein
VVGIATEHHVGIVGCKAADGMALVLANGVVGEIICRDTVRKVIFRDAKKAFLLPVLFEKLSVISRSFSWFALRRWHTFKGRRGRQRRSLDFF